MTKKALCVGINDYADEDIDLNGCVNDAEAWSALLIDHYDFPSSNVTLLLNDQATGAEIMATLTELVLGATEGDVVVFTNSSHGTYVADPSKSDERYDQAICPYDCEDGLIIDDELRELFAKLAEGVSLTVISDSCFSGTVTRARPRIKSPDDRRKRFLYPSRFGLEVLKNPWKALLWWKTKYPETEMKDVLLSGCSNREYSYDALIDGRYHGAMTHYALKAIREMDYDMTYRQWHSRIQELFKDSDFPQTPQLEGKEINKEKKIFT